MRKHSTNEMSLFTSDKQNQAMTDTQLTEGATQRDSNDSHYLRSSHIS